MSLRVEQLMTLPDHSRSAQQDQQPQRQPAEGDAVPGEDTKALSADKADQGAYDEERADEGGE
jgi:hypothetical protein